VLCYRVEKETDDDGRLVISPAKTLEAPWDARNPTGVIADDPKKGKGPTLPAWRIAEITVASETRSSPWQASRLIQSSKHQ
jgi:hypothetical protein